VQAITVSKSNSPSITPTTIPAIAPGLIRCRLEDLSIDEAFEVTNGELCVPVDWFDVDVWDLVVELELDVVNIGNVLEPDRVLELDEIFGANASVGNRNEIMMSPHKIGVDANLHKLL
jgi:hypothetical protein